MAPAARRRAGLLAARTRRLRGARGLSPSRAAGSAGRSALPVAQRRQELDAAFGLPLSFATHPAHVRTKEVSRAGRPAPLWRFLFYSTPGGTEFATAAQLREAAATGRSLEGGWARSRIAQRQGLRLPHSGDEFLVTNALLGEDILVRVLRGPEEGEGILREGNLRSERSERGTIVARIWTAPSGV